MIERLAKGIAPLVALAMADATAGCDADVRVNGDEGERLADLDLAGKTASSLVLAGPDTVVVTKGETLAIDVEGDPAAVDAVRFTLKDGTLGVLRPGRSSNDDSRATVRVTLPTLTKLTIAGSGTVEAAGLSGSPEATIAGSGTARVAEVEADSLAVTLAGSGTIEASGRAKSLNLTVAGSGRANMAGLTADTANVKVAGSGEAAFASDGTVNANVMGSGTVAVTGNATCQVKKMGSGSVTCTRPAASTPAPTASPEAPAT